MSLIKCKDCEHRVSTDAVACPNCGGKLPKKGIGMGGGLFIIIIIFVLFGTFVEKEEPKLTKEQQKNGLQFQHDVVLLRALKGSMNNPNSFQLVKAVRLVNGVLCVTFRGTNAFNAIITQEIGIG